MHQDEILVAADAQTFPQYAAEFGFMCLYCAIEYLPRKASNPLFVANFSNDSKSIFQLLQIHLKTFGCKLIMFRVNESSFEP